MILCAAILQDGVIYCGLWHHQLIRELTLSSGQPIHGSFGFVNDAGDFLSREVAFDEAAKQLQLIRTPLQPGRLFDSDYMTL